MLEGPPSGGPSCILWSQGEVVTSCSVVSMEGHGGELSVRPKACYSP